MKFYRGGPEIKLSQNAEKCIDFYAEILEHNYTTKEVFYVVFQGFMVVVNKKKNVNKITYLKKYNFKRCMHFATKYK